MDPSAEIRVFDLGHILSSSEIFCDKSNGMACHRNCELKSVDYFQKLCLMFMKYPDLLLNKINRVEDLVDPSSASKC